MAGTVLVHSRGRAYGIVIVILFVLAQSQRQRLLGKVPSQRM